MRRDDLKEKDGRDGKKAYIAYKGKVYDVTGSAKWSGGVHMARHTAGRDLSDTLKMAPHGEEMLERVSSVGHLEDSGPVPGADRKHALRLLYRKLHPHPMAIHFPLGIFTFSALMLGVFLLFGGPSFELASFYALVSALVFTPPAMLAGMFSWWVNYDMALTRIFINKLVCSIVVMALGMAAMLLRLIRPEIAYGGSGLSLLYLALVFGILPAVFFIAYNGGKLTWPDA